MYPGIYVGAFNVPGLVQPIEWGPWGRQQQITTQFGLIGATMLDGLRTMRQFSFLMKIYNGFPNRTALEFFLREIDGQIGQVATWKYIDLSGNLILSIDGVEFENWMPGNRLYDVDLGWWCEARLVFRELLPIVPEDEEDLVDPEEE